MSDDIGAVGAVGSSPAPSTAVSSSATGSDSSPAPAIGAPESSAAPTAPATEPGPIPYARFKEVNDDLRAMREWRQRYGWAESVDPEQFGLIQRWAQAYRADPIQWYAQTTAELRQLYPHLVPNLTSEAARILAGSRSFTPEPEIEPDVPVYDDQGRLVSRTFSADRVKQIVQRAVASAIGEHVAPIKQTFERQQAREQAMAMQQEANHAATAIHEAAKTWEGFTEHQAAIAQAFAEHEDWSLQDAYLSVLHSTILPSRDQHSQAKLLGHLQTQAAGATVHPNAPTGTSRPKFSNFKEAAEYYAAHPNEAEAMAQR